MYVSSWPGLTLRELMSSPAGTSRLPYPLSAPDRNAFCVARSGIYHLFRTLRLSPEEVVLAPDYYSGNEIAAMQAAGATVVHYPTLRNLEPDLVALRGLLRRGARVIYVIHYLGWPQPIREISELARENGCLLLEDCALSLLSESEGVPLGAFGDYSVFCLYKTLPVPNGGLLVRNRENVPKLDGIAMEPCPWMNAVGRSTELALEALRSRVDFVGSALGAIKRFAGRILRSASVRHVPVGDIGWNAGNVNVGMSRIGETVMAALDYQRIRERRRENFLALRERLRGRVPLLRDDLPEGVCPLFFPVLVKNKAEIARRLWARGIGAVDFWNDPQDNPQIGEDARFLRAHVLELPIHQDVTRQQVEFIADEVMKLRPEPALC